MGASKSVGPFQSRSPLSHRKVSLAQGLPGLLAVYGVSIKGTALLTNETKGCPGTVVKSKLRDVPIKINGPKARFYARRNSPVFLQKDAQGRYQIIGPADRSQEQGNLIEVDEDTGIAAAPIDIGFTLRIEAFEFYEGTGIPAHRRR